MNNNILILGANGMLGHTVYKYLSTQFPNGVFGTTRKNTDNLFKLEVSSFENDITKIIAEIKSLNYVINCVGVLKNGNLKEQIRVNNNFPKNLSKLSSKLNFKLIHVSTDAVFAENAGCVTESDIANPTNEYGKNKLYGEPKTKNSISIRSSLIGLDKNNHKGLLEWAINAKEPVFGYVNQVWSGSTTLQFAQICEDIIKNDSLLKLRTLSPVFHFSPLGPITKYDLLKYVFSCYKINKKIIKKHSSPVDRSLASNFDYFSIKEYSNIKMALKELYAFEYEK